MQLMNIGDAAAAAGVTPKMIRHYETLGLIPAAERTDAGYRVYGEREVAMLRFIRQSRGLGFSMQQIDALLSLWRDPARRSREVKQVATRQLEELQERQRELDQMRATLEQLVGRCAGDHGAHCAILDTLAQAPGAAVPVPGPGPRKTLKQVRAGERRVAARPAPRPRVPAAAAPSSPHAALSAWTRSFAPAA
jgi:Cu(I)-responsive transcriptional regulator